MKLYCFAYRSLPKIVESLSLVDFVCYKFFNLTSGIVKAMYLNGLAIEFR